MSKYYVNNKQQSDSGRNHEVHKEGCPWMPFDRTYLGEFNTSQAALEAARKIYPDADGCIHCCPEINHDK